MIFFELNNLSEQSGLAPKVGVTLPSLRRRKRVIETVGVK